MVKVMDKLIILIFLLLYFTQTTYALDIGMLQTDAKSKFIPDGGVVWNEVINNNRVNVGVYLPLRFQEDYPHENITFRLFFEKDDFLFNKVSISSINLFNGSVVYWEENNSLNFILLGEDLSSQLKYNNIINGLDVTFPKGNGEQRVLIVRYQAQIKRTSLLSNIYTFNRKVICDLCGPLQIYVKLPKSDSVDYGTFEIQKAVWAEDNRKVLVYKPSNTIQVIYTNLNDLTSKDVIILLIGIITGFLISLFFVFFERNILNKSNTMLNTKTKTIHKNNCSRIRTTSKASKKKLSVEEAINSDYKKCKFCFTKKIR